MRPSHPHGGIPDRVLDLRDAGFLSTGALSQKLGTGSAIAASFIVNDLGVRPRVITNTGSYWAPEQVREIRQALILKLIKDEFAETTLPAIEGPKP